MRCFSQLSPRGIYKTKTLVLFPPLSPVFKKAVILVYRENNKLKKKMVGIVPVTLCIITNRVFGLV